ncbi:hypothetical protein, partial [Halosimplex marinum]|uniref:hypothetical protein n=1 Tax=Halosimplex marinum TaxID=3396620 RepID=UPI003F55B56C
MNSKRSPNESSRIDLLRSIANSVVDDEVYVPTDDELRKLGLDTRPRGKTAKYIVSGNHAAASVSWHVYEIEGADFAPKDTIKLRYRTEAALDGPGRAITGIGRLELDGVGVNQSLLRKKLKEIWTPHNEDAISEDELSNEARS